MPTLTAVSAKGLEKKQMLSYENRNQLPQNWGHSNGKKTTRHRNEWSYMPMKMTTHICILYKTKMPNEHDVNKEKIAWSTR